MKVKILRQVSPESKPYWESFEYDGPKDNSIAGLLEYLNYNDDIITDDGKRPPASAGSAHAFKAYVVPAPW